MAGVRRAVRLLAVAAAVAAATTVVTPARATGPFECHYVLVTWQGGFLADLYVKNNGPTVDDWAAHWSFDHDERVNQVWSGVIVQEGQEVTATPLYWNRTIPAGSTRAIGWTARATTTTVPDDITVNGVPC